MKAKSETRPEAGVVNQEASNNSDNESFEQVLARRLARRNFLKGAAVSTGMLVLNPSAMAENDRDGRDRHGRDRDERPQPLTFQPLQVANLDTVTVAEGYESQVVIRWGDPLFRRAPEFDVDNQTPQAQALQFGFNCDFVGFFPLPTSHGDSRKKRATRGLLVVNHE